MVCVPYEYLNSQKRKDNVATVELQQRSADAVYLTRMYFIDVHGMWYLATGRLK